MTENGVIQFTLYLIILLLLAKPLGYYISQVYNEKPCGLDRFLNPLEHLIYRLCGIQPKEQMGWVTYFSNLLIFNFFGILAVYLIQRFQYYLPLNPETFLATSPDLAFNAAASFTTNTDWQAYSGETTMSYLTQMLALTVQNFLSAASGMSLLVAFVRGLTRFETSALGNYWVDTLRGILYILLPLSLILAILLAGLGVIQNFKPYQHVTLIAPFTYQENQPAAGTPTVETKSITEQIIPMGPAASQIAIKLIGTNGGGFFNSNSAHPFENPTPLTNFIAMIALLLIPAALCHTFGNMVNDKRQGIAILMSMLILFIPLVFATAAAEQYGNPAFTRMGIEELSQSNLNPGGNMEGKETRFGINDSAIYATATTASANGSDNATFDSFTPLGGLVPLCLMHMGEIVFGGVGSGLYAMIMMIILTVFIAGLMVGRTPEYLGKKIEPYEMKMVSMAVLVMPIVVLLLTGLACITPMGTASILNLKAHGLTEVLYAFTSMVNNNGSAFAGLNANTPFYNMVGGIAILIGRYWIAIPTLAIAGSLARKKLIPVSVGTLSTHTPIFIVLTIVIAIVIGALTFFPVLALGPIIEHILLWRQYG